MGWLACHEWVLGMGGGSVLSLMDGLVAAFTVARTLGHCFQDVGRADHAAQHDVLAADVEV